jgi:hypothetical protein
MVTALPARIFTRMRRTRRRIKMNDKIALSFEWSGAGQENGRSRRAKPQKAGSATLRSATGQRASVNVDRRSVDPACFCPWIKSRHGHSAGR